MGSDVLSVSRMPLRRQQGRAMGRACISVIRGLGMRSARRAPAGCRQECSARGIMIYSIAIEADRRNTFLIRIAGEGYSQS